MSNEEQDQEKNLTKRMRLLDGNRKSYAGDTKTHIQKQLDTVNALKRENKKLAEEMKSAEGMSGFHSKYQTELQSKEDSYDTVQRRIDIEMHRAREYEAKMAEYIGSLSDKRRTRADTMGGVNATQENHQVVDKQIKVLENRLDQALVKFNESLSYNKELREQIDNLRRERVVFDGIYKKLEKELHEKKKQMAEIIEKSNLYYEDRDASGVELKHLREAAEKDIQQYERHFEELDLMLEANKNLENSIKNMRTTTKANATQNATEDDDEGGTRRKKLEKGKQAEELEAEQRSVNFQEIVDQLKEATGIQDMEVLHQKFVKAEEQNFSMYNFVNELHAEKESLDGEIEKLKEFTTTEKGDPARWKQLKELEGELSKAEGLAENLNESTIQAKRRIEELQSIISDIFNKVGCSAEEIAEMNGSTECSESNMMMFLGLIEERANEILAAYNVARASEMRSKARLQEEERKQARERRAQERQARREQGEDLGDDDDEEDEADAAAAAAASADAGGVGGGDTAAVAAAAAAAAAGGSAQGAEKTKFLGVGPAVPMGSTNLSKVVESKLPAAGDSFGNDFAEDGEDERPFSQEELRMQTEARLARQLNRDDRTDRGKKKGKEKHRRN